MKSFFRISIRLKMGCSLNWFSEWLGLQEGTNLAEAESDVLGSNIFLALHVLDGLLKSRFSDVISDDTPASTVNKHGPLQQLNAALVRFRSLSNKYIFGDLLLLITAVSNTLWLYLFIWTIVHIPIILINLLMSYRRLPKPQVVEQETES